MRKSVQYGLIALVILLAGSTAVLFANYQKKSTEYTEVKANEETTRNRYAQTIDAIAEIQDSLNAISVGEGSVQMVSGQLQNEKQLNGADSKDALDRIAMLRSSISRNKERILQLESSLKKSGNKVAGLQKMVANLKTSVADREAQVAELSNRVDALGTQVAGLTTEVEQNHQTIQAKDESLEQRRRELATVFVAVGDKKTLETQGVLIAKGGLLGIGKTLAPSGATASGAFTPLDTDQETSIPTNAAKAKVVSAQPPSSYELVLVDGKMTLHILDPNEFRKVRQLVIVTA